MIQKYIKINGYIYNIYNIYVSENTDAVNPDSTGTKCAAHYVLQLAAGEEVQLRMRLYHRDHAQSNSFGPDFDQIFVDRKTECDDFYNEVS